jgi:tetratricopeptide (TPR) repeat protein
MLEPMRLLLLTLFALASAPMRAQAPLSSVIVQASQLWNGGQPKAVVALLEPLLQKNADSLTNDDLGAGWNLLGSSYQDLEMLDKAGHAYERAIEKLRLIPEARKQYAATINNLANLEEARGDMDGAIALSGRAMLIYQELNDREGMAVTSTNTAVMAYARKDYKGARSFLANAFAQMPPLLKDDDVAAMYSVKGALALHGRKYDEAVSSLHQSIDCWMRAHGPGYFMLSTVYLLRAEAVARLGDYGRATADAQQAMAITEASIGRDSLAYLKAEFTYAQILRASGKKEEASQLKKEAIRSLAALEAGQCNGCTIDASGFRD